MITTEHDVVGIGNAIVDVITQTDDAFIREHALTKGTMAIIDAAVAEELYRKKGSSIEISGGSAANTMAGIAGLGGRVAFVGKVGNDQLGDVFRHNICATGLNFETVPNTNDIPTARCFIFVTPDGERTMQTYLGACAELQPEDVDAKLIANSMVTYLEGYLWDPPGAKKALVKAADVAAKAGQIVSLSLSDPFCVTRHREELLGFVQHRVNILFANEEEIQSLYLVETFDQAVRECRDLCDVVVLTRGSVGSVIISSDNTYVINAEPVERVVDTTGAGDAYAAGFLYGYTQGRDLSACARMGGICAGEIITHYGAQSEQDLSKLIRETLR